MGVLTTNQPPGPKSFLGLKSVSEFSNHTLDFITGLHRNYGDVVYFPMGPFKAYAFFHPKDILQILTTHAKKLPKMKRQVKILRQWDGNGLLLSEGEFWQRQHRLVQPAFAAKRFSGYAEVMVKRALARVEKWKAGADFVLDDEMTTLTMEIISETLFGADLGKKTHELGKAVYTLSQIAVDEMKRLFVRPIWLPTAHNRKKQWAMELLDRTIWDFIRERRKEIKDKGDLLSMLLMAVDDEGTGGMTDEQARDEAMVLFLAGHDTTAAGLIWLFYLLANHPAIEKRVLEEVSKLGGRPPKYEDHSKLAFLQQVIKESLRLYPPAIGTFARQATEPVTISGCEIPKNGYVYTFSYVTHRDPRWFPEPEKFDPDRFGGEREKQIPPFAYFPFGGGPRACIGMSFALMEMALVTATILQKGRIELLTKEAPEPDALLSLRPKTPIKCRFMPHP